MNELFVEKNNISYWFPLLLKSKVRVPDTLIIQTDLNLTPVIDGEIPENFDKFADQIKAAARTFGYPVFLRTGHTSGKHGWKDTCFVQQEQHVEKSIFGLIEYSGMCGLIGIPYQTWAVREFLNLKTSFKAFFGQMPVNKERRYFFKDGKVICHHAYWPAEAIEDADHVDWKEKLAELNTYTNTEIEMLTSLTEQVASEFSNSWSVDWAQDNNNDWYAIDMALMDSSYHDPICCNSGK